METAVFKLRRLLMSHTYTINEKEWDAFKNLLHPMCCKPNDRLATHKGDIFFNAEGTLIKSKGTAITRIIKSGQLLFVPLKSKEVQFQALTTCQLLLLPRTYLYEFIEQYPRAIRIYDNLLDLWYEQDDERVAYFEMKKIARIFRFKELHKEVYPYMVRNQIASYISVSEEYLRKYL